MNTAKKLSRLARKAEQAGYLSALERLTLIRGGELAAASARYRKLNTLLIERTRKYP